MLKQIILSIFTLFNVSNSQLLLGSQRGNEGCVTDGGFQWCQSLQKCVRPWMTPCPQPDIDVQPVTPPTKLPTLIRNKGESCGGFRVQNNKCADGLECVYNKHIADAPGICQTKCQTSRDMNGNCIEKNCIVWYDGCNRCMVRNGQINGCTRMFCMKQHQGKPRCMNYEKQKNTPLKLGDICYRFCENNSESLINKMKLCPLGSKCQPTNPSLNSFDSCGNRAYKCILSSQH